MDFYRQRANFFGQLHISFPVPRDPHDEPPWEATKDWIDLLDEAIHRAVDQTMREYGVPYLFESKWSG